MNVALGNGAISEMECGNNFAYVLNENSQFLLTEYKVLQAQGNRGFVKCMKMMHNGKTELYYMASGYKNLASLITLLDADGFMMIAANFIQNIIEVKNNGFLSCQNIALSFDKIFIDMSDYRTYLTYLPANTGQTEDYAAFEAELRTSLIKIIKNSTNLESEKTAQFAVDLSDGTLTLQDLYNHICGTKILPEKTKEKEKDASDQEKRKNLKLVSLNMTKQVELVVTKNEFIIGKNPLIVDGVIPFNSAVSRKHCKIVYRKGEYSVVDLGSVNGTFINKERLEVNCPYPVKVGDILRLANSDFQISEE